MWRKCGSSALALIVHLGFKVLKKRHLIMTFGIFLLGSERLVPGPLASRIDGKLEGKLFASD